MQDTRVWCTLCTMYSTAEKFYLFLSTNLSGSLINRLEKFRLQFDFAKICIRSQNQEFLVSIVPVYAAMLLFTTVTPILYSVYLIIMLSRHERPSNKCSSPSPGCGAMQNRLEPNFVVTNPRPALF